MRKAKKSAHADSSNTVQDFAVQYAGHVLDIPFVQEALGVPYDAAVKSFQGAGIIPLSHTAIPSLLPSQLLLFPIPNTAPSGQIHEIPSWGKFESPSLSREQPTRPLSLAEIGNHLFEGDCLSILPFFPSQSVDLILCDLPYGTTQNKWDSLIPLDALWSQYRRIIKPNGAIVLTSQGIFTAKLILSNEPWFKYKIVWEKSKPTNFLNAKKQPLRKHEDICVFYDKQPTYNPVMGTGVPYDKGVRKNQLSGSYGDFHPVHVHSSGERYPTDIVYFKTAESEGDVWHPTQKPVALARYLVKTFSNPGDLVLDNAFGSGSFLVGAALEGRRFVGIEKNEDVSRFKTEAIDYVALAYARLLFGRSGGPPS